MCKIHVFVFQQLIDNENVKECALQIRMSKLEKYTLVVG